MKEAAERLFWGALLSAIWFTGLPVGVCTESEDCGGWKNACCCHCCAWGALLSRCVCSGAFPYAVPGVVPRSVSLSRIQAGRAFISSSDEAENFCPLEGTGAAVDSPCCAIHDGSDCGSMRSLAEKSDGNGDIGTGDCAACADMDAGGCCCRALIHSGTESDCTRLEAGIFFCAAGGGPS